MTPIRQILEKHKELVFRSYYSDEVKADKYAIMDSEFEAIEKEILAFLPIDGILRNGYVNFLPKESTDFTMNVSGDEEIISIP